jgi:hypothetical protein
MMGMHKIVVANNQMEQQTCDAIFILFYEDGSEQSLGTNVGVAL